ncbi:MAG TPA: glycoside hydrolase family 43 protein [Bryobacteraceae bacterium]|nr:glycoside hydrolase family 43 protein [Bryobacteraceae bacterium]
MAAHPLLPRGADPWVVHHDGWYYYTQTTFRNVAIWRVRDLAELKTARRKIVWRPPAGTEYSQNLWAPELHLMDGKWYIYFAADDGHNRNHRLYVLENSSPDPTKGEWRFMGQLRTPGDCWAIDGSVFRCGGHRFLLWSGWEGCENGLQNIYIARLADPLTVSSPRVVISTPEFEWERHGRIAKPGPDDKPHVYVNEGPAALIRNGRIWVTYSASGSWTEYYCVGLLWADLHSDLLNRASWNKCPEPVFTAVGAGVTGTCAAGHNSFFRSPDGTEDWILYHANSAPGEGWTKRSPRAQRFNWDPMGCPQFGRPGVIEHQPASMERTPADEPGAILTA